MSQLWGFGDVQLFWLTAAAVDAVTA